MNAVVFVAAIVAVVIALTVLSRASGRKKRMAREDLKREQEQVGHFDILELVRQELDETGAGDVPGGDGVDPTVLLRVWRRDQAVRDDCSGGLRFVIADGVAPADAEVDVVKLVCDDQGTEAEKNETDTEGGTTSDDEADTPADDETAEDTAGAEDEEGAPEPEATESEAEPTSDS
jgi:hypothetical protein